MSPKFSSKVQIYKTWKFIIYLCYRERSCPSCYFTNQKVDFLSSWKCTLFHSLHFIFRVWQPLNLSAINFWYKWQAGQLKCFWYLQDLYSRERLQCAPAYSAHYKLDMFTVRTRPHRFLGLFSFRNSLISPIDWTYRQLHQFNTGEAISIYKKFK